MDTAELQKIIKHKVLLTGDDYPYGEWIFDFRRILFATDTLTFIAQKFLAKIPYDRFQVGGLESASLPIITAIVLEAKKMNKIATGFYVRKSRKKYGLHQLIDGVVEKHLPTILVDDLMNSGSSILRQVQALEEINVAVNQVLTIVQFRDNEYYTHLRERDIDFFSIFSLEHFPVSLDTQNDPYKHTKYDTYTSIWKFQIKNPNYKNIFPRSTPAVHQGFVYFGADDGYFYALEKNSGKLIWKFATGNTSGGKNILSSPICTNNKVYFGAYDGKVYALDAYSGEIIWVYTEAEWVGSSPTYVPAHNAIVIGLEHAIPNHKGSVVALDADSGEKIWQFEMLAFTHASPLYLIDHDQIAIGGNEGRLYLLKASSGELVWSFETEGGAAYSGEGGFSPGDIKMKPTYDSETDFLAFSSVDGHVYILDRSKGTMIRRFHTERTESNHRISIYGSPVFTKRHVIFGAPDRYVYCYNKYDGTLMWKFQTVGRIFASPAVHKGIVYIGTTDGMIYEIFETSGIPRSKNSFSDRITTTVVLDKYDENDDPSHMYVITNSTHLYCMKIHNE